MDSVKFKEEVTKLLTSHGVESKKADFLHHELLSIYKQNFPERHEEEHFIQFSELEPPRILQASAQALVDFETNEYATALYDPFHKTTYEYMGLEDGWRWVPVAKAE